MTKQPKTITLNLPMTAREVSDIHNGNTHWTLEKLGHMLPAKAPAPAVGLAYCMADAPDHRYEVVAVGEYEVIVNRTVDSRFGPAGERLVQSLDRWVERAAFGEMIFASDCTVPQDAVADN